MIWDTELAGFGLRLQPSGTKTWFVRVRRRGKQQRVTIGGTKEIDAATRAHQGTALIG